MTLFLKKHAVNLPFVCLPAIALVFAASCGGDDAAPKAPAKSRSAGASKSKSKKKKSGKPSKFAYAKVAQTLRHEFSEVDFAPGPNGDKKRDPFRSWVLQPALVQSESVVVAKTDVCTEAGVRWEGKNFSHSSLKLIGIVKRGRSFAQFSAARESFVVRRGDCLGQEKAIVEEIGVGYVTLAETPEAAPGAAAPATQRHERQLFPEQYSVLDAVAATEGR